MARSRKVDPRQQFSKKLAGRMEWFWFGYMLILAGCIAYRPEAGMSAVYLGIMVTFCMIVSVVAYTRNSTSEKAYYWGVELAKVLSGKAKEKEGAEDEEDLTDEGGNG